jgi:hypothetical protein
MLAPLLKRFSQLCGYLFASLLVGSPFELDPHVW